MYEVCGIRYVNMKDGADVIQGFSVFFLVDEPDPEFKGHSTAKVFFSSSRFPDFRPQLGEKYLLIFNQKGRLQAYQKMES